MLRNSYSKTFIELLNSQTWVSWYKICYAYQKCDDSTLHLIKRFLLQDHQNYRRSWRGLCVFVFFSQLKFWPNPTVPLHKSKRLSGCLAQNLIPSSIVYPDEPQSQCMMGSHFLSQKKIHNSQLLLCIFKTLLHTTATW